MAQVMEVQFSISFLRTRILSGCVALTFLK